MGLIGHIDFNADGKAHAGRRSGRNKSIVDVELDDAVDRGPG
jgi:hypothetical protein